MALVKTVYLSLGSNLGDRRANLQRAVELMGDAGVRVLRASAIYETEPMYLEAQPRFLNQMVEAETALFPRQLVAVTQSIEKAVGRKPSVRNGPRAIDIDIVLFGKSVVNLPALQVPHPRMAERRFVLEPLAELAPDLRHPVTHRTVREMLASVKKVEQA
jgi:2-amino-4-hydroxy-6-hydroxymethyldihydropteridine diphosphokinase